MSESFILSRVLLRFKRESEDLLGDISAVALTPDGSLWLGSDELLGIERLSPIEPYIYGNHQHFRVGDFVELFNQEDEIDIEGMDYADNYLWLTGSHSTKRNKPKGKKVKKDIKRLAEIETDLNRYLLARIPIINGELVKSYSPTDGNKLTSACLQKTGETNILLDALAEDEHLGRFITSVIPSKDNGLDLEGLAVKGNRVFLGLRGPVLRGWAVIIELELTETEPGILTFKKIGQDDRLYRKHFVELNGLGIRELCWRGKDLLILGGPTMSLDGALRIFRLKDALKFSEDTLTTQDSDDLEVLFDLPFKIGADHAEGLTLFPCLGHSDSLLVVYDSPDINRKPNDKSIFADVFRLP